MASDPWIDLQMTVAELRFDVSVAEVQKVGNRIRSIVGFCSEDEKAEQNWDNMMKQVNEHHHEMFLSHILQPL